MQWEGRKRQPSQRSPLGPPRARNGRVLRASRAWRKRETACGGSVEARVFCGVGVTGDKGVEAGKTDTSRFGQMPGLSRLCQFQC
ncbi:hypothetical protein CTTA_2202 [Comamonas testosteroni]|uniref:Uncharacterized protein n=1 Tax=Comamonas testosteroni TaxID=285 RepID=A0A5A7MBI7_COMTE|nr:hypothetical protein CTTA_2202 [Comamonas testosteroni]